MSDLNSRCRNSLYKEKEKNQICIITKKRYRNELRKNQYYRLEARNWEIWNLRPWTSIKFNNTLQQTKERSWMIWSTLLLERWRGKIINQVKKTTSKNNKPAWETRLGRESTKVAKWHKIIESRVKQEEKTNQALKQIPNKPETNICLTGNNKREWFTKDEKLNNISSGLHNKHNTICHRM